MGIHAFPHSLIPQDDDTFPSVNEFQLLPICPYVPPNLVNWACVQAVHFGLLDIHNVCFHFLTSHDMEFIDGSSLAQHSSNKDPNSQQPQHNPQCHDTSSATSLPTASVGQLQLANGLPNGQGLRVPGSFIQDPVALSQMQKKLRLDIKQEDILQ
ncbi:hypothetical protein T459_09254 [Capsicum annuum]|uniref:Uncharacterized protein n=1 Tax=Capsicum annuum TaxID=4072 RepID=A0A2G2ZYV2_CAPAN|nr:hypothetical protein T459_09254 [Capsicum annuum]